MARCLALFLLATLAARLVSIFATGFCDDEAYGVTISRAWALSYFDHPPLHQWVLAGWAAAFGEGRAARLPFFGFSLVTTVALYGIARRLFSAAAGGWTVFAFAASAYFLVYPDGYLMPDPPLLAFCALGVWAVAEVLYGPPGRATPLWLAAGLALGLAGLSKYSAAFVPLGLAGHFVGTPRGRAWLSDPRPWAGAALGALCLAPVVIWNGEHGWVSLAFQSGRAARGLALNVKTLGQVFEDVGAQAAAMTPWIALPLVAGLASAVRRGPDSPQRFLLWQAAPPLLLFTLMPFFGQRPIAHWFNSGWLFAFPLAGAWLAERTPGFQRRFFATSAVLSGLVFALYFGAVILGPLPLKGVRDPTAAMFDWPVAPLRDVYAGSGADFVLVDNWRLGGRVGVALGPEVAICATGDDPRGFAFACDTRRRIRQNALVIQFKERGKEAEVAEFFGSVTPLGEMAVGRNGATERALALTFGRDLKVAPPLPYGP